MFVHGEGEELVPSHLNFGKFMLHRLLKVQPDTSCLENCTTGEKLSYEEVTTYAQRLAGALTRRGVQRGDTVGVATEPRVAQVPTALFAGAAVTKFQLSIGRGILTHQINLTKPKYVICSRLFWEAYGDILKSSEFIQTLISFEPVEGIELCVESLVAERAGVATLEPVHGCGDEVAFIAYSSGTTGMCKGVLLTHLNMIARCDTTAPLYRDIIESYQTICMPRLDPTSPYIFYHTCKFISVGKTVLYTETNFDWDIVKNFQIDAFITVPKLVENMLDVEEDLSSLKVVNVTGEALHPRTAKAFIKKYPHISLIQHYGMTELARITGNKIVSEDLNGELTPIGFACASITLKVVDVDTRAVLGPNQRGEICVRSPRLMKGYLGTTEPYIDEQGFLLTGDLGYYDQQKCFFLVNRLKELIIYKGWHKVCPSDIEAILLQHSSVLEAAVVGVPAGADGQRPVALAVLRPGADAAPLHLHEFVNSQVPRYMRLAGLRLLPALPRTKTGKVLRRQLRELWLLQADQCESSLCYVDTSTE